MLSALNIWPQRHVIWYKAWADFRAESQRTYLGYLWWIIDPILNTVLYFLVFGYFLSRGGPDFIPYLVIGIVGWFWFAQSVDAAGRSIWQNANLLRQVSIKKLVFPCSQIVNGCLKFGFSMIVVVGALLLYRFFPGVWWLLLPIPILVELLFIAGIAFLLAAVVPFVPDIAGFVPYVLRFAFFMSAIMYKLEELPELGQAALYYNPMVHILEAYRAVLMYETAPDWGPLAVIALGSIAAILIGAALVHRFDGLYAKRIVS